VLTLEKIQEAQKRIAPWIKRTPLVPSEALSCLLGAQVYLKLELFQKTGSFKVRGAFNKLLQMKGTRRVVAVSGGNHAQAVAYAAKALGLEALILMPEDTPKNSLEATRNYGAEIRLTATISEAFSQVEKFEKEGWALVHPFDDFDVMAGQGTIGLEIFEDLPTVTDCVVSVGGGGLIGGISTALKSLKSTVRIWGVETKGADSMARALAAGKIVTLEKITTIAKTLGAPAVSEKTLSIGKRNLEKVVVVSDKAAVEALELLLERAKVLTEPAASCTLAAAFELKSEFHKESHVVLVLCGGNVSLNDLIQFKAR